MNSFSKDHFSTLLKYLGISFITGSISHGFFSGERAAVLAGLGIVFFIAGTLIPDEKKSSSYVKTILLSIGLALSIGMFTGGLQHFLDSPERSLLIVPIGMIFSLIFFAVLHTYILTKKEYIYGILIAILATVFSFGYFYYIATFGISEQSHGHTMNNSETVPQNIQIVQIPKNTIIPSLPPIIDESSHHNH